jgi:hypothetical protein
VIHPTVDLAVKMGAAQIILFVADFAFPRHSVAGISMTSFFSPLECGQALCLRGVAT